MKALSDLLNEADDLIKSKVDGIAKSASAVTADDDVFKLAEALRQNPASSYTKEAAAPADDELFTLTEKIAHAAAIVDTWLNLPAIARMVEFEKVASKNGYSKDQISSYIEKNAEAFKIVSILS